MPISSWPRVRPCGLWRGGIPRDDHGAEDVVQETFRMAIERVREEVGSRAERVGSDQVGADPGRDEREWVQRSVLAALERLKEPSRTVVRLRYIDGLSPPEVARSLGVSPNTVKTRLRRELEQLRASLDGENGGRRRWLAALVGLVGEEPASAASPALALPARMWFALATDHVGRSLPNPQRDQRRGWDADRRGAAGSNFGPPPVLSSSR